MDELLAEDSLPAPPLPPPAEAPAPEGPVPVEEEEVARVADLDDALWVLCQACKAQPSLQHKAGLYRHGGVVGILGGTLDRPWLTQLMVQVLSAVAPGTEYTSLWLSNSTAQSMHADPQFAGIHKRSAPLEAPA